MRVIVAKNNINTSYLKISAKIDVDNYSTSISRPISNIALLDCEYMCVKKSAGLY